MCGTGRPGLVAHRLNIRLPEPDRPGGTSGCWLRNRCPRPSGSMPRGTSGSSKQGHRLVDGGGWGVDVEVRPHQARGRKEALVTTQENPALPGELSTTQKRVAQAKHTAFRVTGVLDTTFVGRLWSRLLELEFVDRSVALAAKAFVSLFPALIIVTAITPDSVRKEVLDSITRRFGVSGSAFAEVKQAFASPSATREASGIIGIVLTIAFAVSFTTALQRT